MPPPTEHSNTYQIGQDLNHTHQTPFCIQWAYLLRVLVDFQPFSFNSSAHIVFAKLSTSKVIAQFSISVEKGAVNLTGAMLSQYPDLLTADNSFKSSDLIKCISHRAQWLGLWIRGTIQA